MTIAHSSSYIHRTGTIWLDFRRELFYKKNVWVHVSLIGNPVQFGDGPAAVTLPSFLERGTPFDLIRHCRTG
jgi:hypothetical protein